MGKACKIVKVFGGPWCDGCSSKAGCTPDKPNCHDDPSDRRCGMCANAVGFEFTPTGRFKAHQGVQCSAEVVWPPLPFFLTEMLPRKGGQGSRDGCWWGRTVWPQDGKDCPCWKGKE